MPEEDPNELWAELLDLIAEVKTDAKDNRRAKRHIRDLELVVSQIGQMLSRMAGKKGFLR